MRLLHNHDIEQLYMDLELTNEDYDGIVNYLRKNIIASQRRSKKEQAAATAAASNAPTSTSSTLDNNDESDQELNSPKKPKREPVVWTKEEVSRVSVSV